ncbi:helix-turn-helix transcriptional regulator [Marinobacterium rhizophilum]|uniref:Helix-turn-helix transcriptional regulator n=1 Tax=Marinobacterium rhizophilum TaxID=420402 RepID=A0ABY5HF05_9GAMM|nr:AraC family transcriptional regulator [Marinobacterium rhizophilum]UTW10704.1 helix-turn-helix transcriptional regulator [Marinobacterium rhizophilum]
MKNTPVLLESPATAFGITLRSVWDIYADESYQVLWPRDKKLPLLSSAHVCVFTRQGHGVIRLKSGREIHAKGTCALFLESRDIQSYACEGLLWELYWVEFVLHGPATLPLNLPVVVRDNSSCIAEFLELVQSIRVGDGNHQAYAAAIFTKVLYQWIAQSNHHADPAPLRRIQTVISQMHGHTDERWSVKDMARLYGASEQQFRKVFLQYIGQTPKEYFMNLKLDMAHALLNRGSLNVSQAAFKLGFSDAFHLSKAFKSRFGYSPSDVIREPRDGIDNVYLMDMGPVQQDSADPQPG